MFLWVLPRERDFPRLQDQDRIYVYVLGCSRVFPHLASACRFRQICGRRVDRARTPTPPPRTYSGPGTERRW